MLSNATAHIQPYDQGIINSFKYFYKKNFISNRINAYDSVSDNPNENLPDFTILDAIYIAADAWKKHYNIENEQAHDLDDMIARLPIDNPLSADEFIHLDDVLLIEEIPNNIILIEQIRCKQDDEDAQSDEEDNSTTVLCKFSLRKKNNL
ncbi:3507_t:CDS:2 [Scutellospora calospora]|uniref:3507_t:CDS:1 n=1 Tax=Scutellospora calospora TaxID=85575 RepID=A0ACA9LDM3_9GLOM|nr:3507_t:CDS:2 [Scutellospora calospora]